MRRLIGSLALLFSLAMSGAAANAAEIPAEFLGQWSTDCRDEAAPRVFLERQAVRLTVDGHAHAFQGVEVSHTWYGGAKASGNRAWLLVSRQPGGMFAFIAALPPYGTDGSLMLEGGVEEEMREMLHLMDIPFIRCR
ncbi:hypothetical protein [Pararhizobium haloflavum]|uniref:hypothetical protein n=1 Tax=Pararhizobium haloflavum TaxID=2037914 RepID=UPI000C19B48D|nr:hypothetical protein [Pararhizobium haloflavum]